VPTKHSAPRTGASQPHAGQFRADDGGLLGQPEDEMDLVTSADKQALPPGLDRLTVSVLAPTMPV